MRSGRGMGGGSGGGVLRTVQRAVRAGVGGGPTEPFSPAANSTTIRSTNSRKTNHFNGTRNSTHPNTTLTLKSPPSANSGNNNDNGSSAFSSLMKLPVSTASGVATPAWGSSSSPPSSEDLEWECVDVSEDERARVFYEDFVFGTVPSSDEVQYAVSALQQVFESPSFTQISKEKHSEDTSKEVADEVTIQQGFGKGICSDEPIGVDWVEPSWDLCSPRMLNPYGSNRVYEAFHLLQTEPSIQRMVMSLSSDKSVWDAVLNNDVVKELRSSITQDSRLGQYPDDKQEESPVDASGTDSNPVRDILGWVLMNAKTRIMQLIDNITKFVNDFLQSPKPKEMKEGGDADPFEEKLKTSLFLSVIVLLIVVVARARIA